MDFAKATLSQKTMLRPKYFIDWHLQICFVMVWGEYFWALSFGEIIAIYILLPKKHEVSVQALSFYPFSHCHHAGVFHHYPGAQL